MRSTVPQNITLYIEWDGYSFKEQSISKGIIVLASSEILPTFGIIIDIILMDNENAYFVCEELTTEEFSGHLHSFVVRRETPIPLVFCKQHELSDYHPLGLYRLRLFRTTCLYVVPQYHLM